MFSLSLEPSVSVCVLLGDLVHGLVKVPIYASSTLMMLLFLSLSPSLSLSLYFSKVDIAEQCVM